jgi:hypothetical protein
MKLAAAPPSFAPRFRCAQAAIVTLATALLVTAALAQEVQVPLDRSGRIERIDAQLAKRLGAFGDRFPGFTEARLFRAPDSTFTLEVTMARGGQILRERVPLSPAGADSLRDRVTLLIAEKAPQMGRNQEGRTLLIASTTLLGLGFYGWALPVAGDVNNDQTAVGIYLLTAAGSFFLPFAATGGHEVTYGMTDLAIHGATRGIVHGILVYQLFAGNENTSNGNIGSAVVGSLAEGLGGYVWAQRTHMSAGSATTIGTLSDFGMFEGFGAAALADYYDNDHNEQASAVILAGSAVGAAGGAVLAGNRRYSYGDAAVMRNAGILGAFAAEMITDWFKPEDNAYITAAMVGGVVGLAAGDRLVANTDFSVNQSVLVTLGMVAGGALGLGVGYVSSGSSSDNGTLLLTSSMIGSALGFAGTYMSALSTARPGREGRSSLRLDVSPLAPLLAARHGSGGSASGIANVPLVRVSCRF